MSLKTSLLAASLALGCVAAPSLADTYSGDLFDDIGGSASSENDFSIYVFGAGGWVSGGDLDYGGTDYDRSEGAAGEAGIGIRFTKNIRLDAAFQYNNFVIDEAAVEKFSAYTSLYTLYYDFTNDSSWTPYIGYGFGSAEMITDSSSDREDEDVTVNQFKVGVTYETASNLDLFGEFVWQGYSDSNMNNTDIDEFDQWKAQAGLRYSFF